MPKFDWRVILSTQGEASYNLVWFIGLTFVYRPNI